MSPAGRPAAVLWFLALAGSSTHAQVHVYSPNYHSFDTISDPRSVAMGESSVADAGDPAAFSSNPANLAFVSERGFYCNYRSFDWLDDIGIEDWSAWSAGVASTAPLGGMALAFNRRGLSSSDSREYDQTLSLAYAISRGNLAVGGALRLFNRYFYLESHLDPEYAYESSYLPSIDVGVLFRAWESTNGPHGGLFLGMALQNYSSNHAYAITFEGRESRGKASLPLYLRTGFRYLLDWPSEGRSPPLRFVVSAEHRGIYDPGGEYRPGVWDDDDFGGIGLELTLYRWLSLRTGWINEHGGRLHNRLGLGIDLSPDGEYLPGKVGLDYALLRVPESSESTGFVHSFGLRISW